MARYFVDVMLQFPAMPEPYRVQVPVRQLYFLDRHTIRIVGPDGAVVYRMPPGMACGEWVDMFRSPGAVWAN